jgi:hypothetical protein
VLHLAFGECALLADEMGLGKRPLSDCGLRAVGPQGYWPSAGYLRSFAQGEWEEQIAGLTTRAASSVFGPCATRLAADVIILDEAQPIQNWQIKTARQVKSLRSRYAFVLSGTPVETRIDDLYSIV